MECSGKICTEIRAVRPCERNALVGHDSIIVCLRREREVRGTGFVFVESRTASNRTLCIFSGIECTAVVDLVIFSVELCQYFKLLWIR